MKKCMVVICVFAFLLGCSACGKSSGECDQKIVLKVSREFRQDVMYVVCADGSGKVDYELPGKIGDYPDWSPDGEWITYQRETRCENDELDTQIFVQNLTTNQEYKVSDVCSGAEHPHWSADGTQIIYEGRGVEMVDVSCIFTQEECVFEPKAFAREYSPTWHPDGDGESIVFEMYNDTLLHHRLMLVDVEKPEESIPLNAEDTSSCCTPNWSPVDNKIVAQCQHDEEEFYVFEISNSGYTAKSLHVSGYYPTWSPDGMQIAFASVDEAEGLGKCVGGDCTKLSMALFVVDCYGSNPTRLTTRDDESILWFSWIP